MGKAKATVSLETEPRFDAEDTKDRLQAMRDANPSLRTLFSEMVGVKTLPPNAVAVVDWHTPPHIRRILKSLLPKQQPPARCEPGAA